MKKAIALLTVAVMLLSFAACGSKDENETSTTDTTTVASEEVNGTTVADETTAVPETEIITEVVTDKNGEKVTDKSGEAVTKKIVAVKKTTTKKDQTTKADAKTTTKKQTADDPSTTAQIVSFFNDATKLISTQKPGFNKTKTVTLTKMAPKALASIDIIKSVVEDFVGAGTQSKSVSKGSNNSEYIRATSLTPSDVLNATCTSSGNNYVITLTVKGSTNPEKGSSPIGRLTNDYKSKSEIENGLTEVTASDDNLKSFGKITEKMNTATAKIVVDKSTKKISSYTIDYTYNAVIEDVKYIIIKATANADAKGSVKYSSFNW